MCDDSGLSALHHIVANMAKGPPCVRIRTKLCLAKVVWVSVDDLACRKLCWWVDYHEIVSYLDLSADVLWAPGRITWYRTKESDSITTFRGKVWWWKFGLCLRVRIGLIYHTSHSCVVFCLNISSWLHVHIWLGLRGALCLALLFFDRCSRTITSYDLHNLRLLNICLLLWNASIGGCVMSWFDSVLTETFNIKGSVEMVANSMFFV